MICPICNGHTVGKVGNNQFYCWRCYIEFSTKKDGFAIFKVDDEGELIEVIDLTELSSYSSQ